MAKKISAEEIMVKIYTQIKDLRENNLFPYYLLISQNYFDILKIDLLGNKHLFPDGKIDFIENLEVVVLSQVSDNFLEVKGLNLHVSR